MQPATPDKKKEIMDRITKTEQKFGELFGGKPVQDEGTDPEFMRILQRFIFGEVCCTGSLDNRLRELVTVTVLTVNQTLPQLKAHVGACLNVGVPPLEIREAVYQCAPFIGFPKTLNAIAAMNDVFTQKGIALPLEKAETVTGGTRMDKGKEIQHRLYGDEIARRYTWLPEDFSGKIPQWLTELCFGDFATRRGLEGKTRELLTVVILAALGGAENQVRSHTAGAIKAGSTMEEIISALSQALPYMGFPRLFNALNALRDIVGTSAGKSVSEP